MKKLLSFMQFTSWMFLFLLFCIDDKQSSCSDVQMFTLVGVIVSFWAVTLLSTFAYISYSKAKAKEQEGKEFLREQRHQERNKEAETFDECYRQAFMDKTNKLVIEKQAAIRKEQENG